MKLNIFSISLRSILIFSFAFAVNAAGLSSPSYRANSTEVSFQIRNTSSIQLTTDNNVNVDIDDTVGWAFGIGHNFTNKWAFNFDMAWNDSNYKAKFIDNNGDSKTYSNRMYSSAINFGGTYHFLAKRFTPFIGASVGWAFVDSNIRDGRDEVYCPPYYYTYCYSYTPTKDSTEFTYGAQFGFRFDVNDQLFLKISAVEQWMELSGVSSTTESTSYRFEIGTMF